MISVIISNYNKEKYLEETIKSILAQSYSKLELIIVDDASTDNSVKIIKKYTDIDERLIPILLDYRSGSLVKARNIGFKKAKGDFLTICDSDDIWKSNKLEIQLRIASQFENFDGIISCGNYQINSEGKTIKLNVFPSKKDLLYFQKESSDDWIIFEPYFWLFKNYSTASGLFISKIFFNKEGYLDESLNWIDDYEIVLRCVSHNYKLVYSFENLVGYRIHDENITNQLDFKTKKNLYLLVKIYFGKIHSNKYNPIDKQLRLTYLKLRYLRYQNIENKRIINFLTLNLYRVLFRLLKIFPHEKRLN